MEKPFAAVPELHLSDDQKQTKTEHPTEFPEMHIFPNPASDFITINLYLEDFTEVEISLHSLLGKQISEWKGSGENHFYHKMLVHELAAGKYIVKVNVSGKETTRLISVVK